MKEKLYKNLYISLAVIGVIAAGFVLLALFEHVGPCDGITLSMFYFMVCYLISVVGGGISLMFRNVYFEKQKYFLYLFFCLFNIGCCVLWLSLFVSMVTSHDFDDFGVFVILFSLPNFFFAIFMSIDIYPLFFKNKNQF